MPTPESTPAELFESHAAFVRRLARALVRDEASALDLEQDTWCAVVAQPPAHLDRVRGWLALVVRRLASRQRRDDAARQQRERLAARAERFERGPTDTIEALVAALRALREPLRTTLVRRYFEDLTPREIARAEGVPIETVKSRLKRGLRELRWRLDERLGGGDDERCSLALLAAFGEGIGSRTAAARTTTAASRPGATVWTTAWSLSMNTQPKVALALALLLAPAAFWFFSHEPVEVSPSAPSTVVSRSKQVLSDAAIDAASIAGVERIEVPDPARPTPTESAAPSEFAIEIRVEDRDGLPLSQVLVHGAPDAHPFNLLGTTGSDGRFECRWAGRGPSQILHLRLLRSGTDLVGLRAIRVFAGELSRHHFVTTDVVVAEQPAASIARTQVLAKAAAAERKALSETLQSVRGIGREFGPLQSFAPPRQGPRVSSARELGDGRIEFCVGQPGAADAIEIGLKSQELAALLDALKRRRELGATPRSAADSSRTQVAGQIVDARGVPAEGMLVAAHETDRAGAMLAATRTDRDGRYEFAVRTGAFEVRVGASRRQIDGIVDDHVTCDLQIDLGPVLTGTVSLADGTPIESAIVEARARDANGVHWVARAVTRADGQFRITRCPTARVDLDVYCAGFVPELPIARTLDAQLGAPCQIFVDAAALVRTPVTFGIDDAGATGAIAGEIRILDESGRVGAVIAALGTRGAVQPIELPRGVWQLAVLARDPREIALGAVHVEDRPIELGAFAFEHSATVSIDCRGGSLDGCELDAVLHLADVDTWVVAGRTLIETAGSTADVDLPAGDYSITLRRVDPDGGDAATVGTCHRVRLAPGEQRVLRF